MVCARISQRGLRALMGCDYYPPRQAACNSEIISVTLLKHSSSMSHNGHIPTIAHRKRASCGWGQNHGHACRACGGGCHRACEREDLFRKRSSPCRSHRQRQHDADVLSNRLDFGRARRSDPLDRSQNCYSCGRYTGGTEVDLGRSRTSRERVHGQARSFELRSLRRLRLQFLFQFFNSMTGRASRRQPLVFPPMHSRLIDAKTRPKGGLALIE